MLNCLSIQGLKRLVRWIQNLSLLEDQGLWIQTSVLYLSNAKAASGGSRTVPTSNWETDKPISQETGYCLWSISSKLIHARSM